jgi:hypothetical protein
MVETPPVRLLAMLAFPKMIRTPNYSSELDKYAMTFDTKVEDLELP